MVLNMIFTTSTVVPLIKPPYLPRNCEHIREVAFGERRSKYIDSSSGKDLWPY